MAFWETLAVVGTAATLLGGFLTVYGVNNNRTFKAGFGRMHSDMQEGFRQMHTEMQEGFRRMDAGFKQMHEEAQEGIRLIAVLITEKDEQKRGELIKRLLPVA